MTERIWDQLLTQQGKTVFSQVGVSQQSGVIRRHALLAMDANYNFTGDKPDPISETSKRLQPVMRAFRSRVPRYKQDKCFKRDIDAVPEIDINGFDRDQCATALPSLAR